MKDCVTCNEPINVETAECYFCRLARAHERMDGFNRRFKRRYWTMVAVAAVGWLLALLAIAELLSLYL